MNRALVRNVASAFLDRGFIIVAQMAAMALIVRFLPREDYGVMGVVAGFTALVQILNLSIESIILRDHRLYGTDAPRFLLNFMAFNCMKALPMAAAGMVLAWTLPGVYGQPGFLWAVLSLTVITIAECLISPLAVYASARYQQYLVTRVNVLRYSVNLILLTGLLWKPTLQYLFIKDLMVSVVVVAVWAFLARPALNLSFAGTSLRKDVDPRFILRTLGGYSIWVHLVSVGTAIIYRIDALVLSFFAPLSVVGSYSVAKNAANVANVAPAIFGYQNSVALSHARDRTEAFRLTDGFLRLSAYVGFATLIGFLALGIPYLKAVTGDPSVTEIFTWMLCIVSGLVLVKTVASPLVAYINVSGDVRALFVRVMLPLLAIAATCYCVTAKFLGPFGLAIGNFVVALAWLGLLLLEVRRYGYRISRLSGWAGDLQRLRSLIASRWQPAPAAVAEK
ncbi:O-antigen/teichoic acid export membrane protein [Povalibacter uvarum]|uniref:O-antigen/teichoic acid export membrane protein n=1 Tax=Povalibacter uvarum TaxID=732238 RepID=A0A841HEH8_9GAMM|nr:oligosaccharide flippase family protein [Povalibacter uvarum]MBB6091257.1 O-antigen/teichoic acid export membrane protein [Povalibacter uvarum]